MRNYDLEYIDTHFILMEVFLFKANKNLLDVSYYKNEKKIVIQVVMLKGYYLSNEIIVKIRESLSSFDVEISELQLTKEEYNENRGEWLPIHYKWLDYMLFSKAEVL